jgi:hypothetical protein
MGVKMNRVYALAAALIAALVLSSVAVAGGSLVTSYGGQAQQALVKTTTASKAKAAKASSGTSGAKASGTLPFTGLDLGLLFVGGTALVLTGAGLRRSARNKS